MRKRVCFAVSSCFAQQEKRASETLLCAEVVDWTPLREPGVKVRAGEIGCPNTYLKVRDANVESRSQVSQCTFQVAWA